MTEAQGNFLILICKPCQQANEKDYGAKLAVRSRIGWYEQMIPQTQLDKWLAKHAKCAGRGHPDHFVLGLRFEADHDQQSLQAAVKLAVMQ